MIDLASNPGMQGPRRGRSEPGEETIHFRPRRRRYEQAGTLMSLSRFAPMIDMSFLLLIFFMTTTRFAQPEGLFSSEMPQYGAGMGSGPHVPLPETPVVVRLRSDDTQPQGVQLSLDRFPGAPTALSDLPTFLRQVQKQPGFDADTPVIIVAENQVRWEHVVHCWNAALRAGCKNIAFAEP